jgi:DNA repair protein RadA/Sms
MENRLEPILDCIGDGASSVVVVDSIQSLSSRSVETSPGSVLQVRHAAASIVDSCKRGSSACFIVGHVTKGGDLAGPKALEHVVDTVLSFEGDRSHSYRILRAVKNRFGSASEIGVFEMGDVGLVEVANPSELFLSERPQEAAGSVVTALMEGSRPLLVELQSLVSGPVAGQGRRTCLGTDPQRLALMIAVLEKKLGLTLVDQDIFLNVVGGIRAMEPAADLAIAAAVLSSFMDRPVPTQTVVMGEVGLAGEVRRISRAAARMNEAVRLGFRQVLAPRSNLDPSASIAGAEIVGVGSIGELASLLFTW